MGTSWNTEAIKLYAYQLGKRVARQRSIEAIASTTYYLYNNSKMPKLPARNEIEHPCALIVKYRFTSTETTVLYFMAQVSDRDVTVSSYTGKNIDENIYYHPGDIQYVVEHKKGETFTSWGEPIVLTDRKMFGVDNVLWTNTDLVLQFDSNHCGSAGELYRPKSEPIPVYENE